MIIAKPEINAHEKAYPRRDQQQPWTGTTGAFAGHTADHQGQFRIVTGHIAGVMGKDTFVEAISIDDRCEIRVSQERTSDNFVRIQIGIYCSNGPRRQTRTASDDDFVKVSWNTSVYQNSSPFVLGEADNKPTLEAPALSPPIVTESGSPLNRIRVSKYHSPEKALRRNGTECNPHNITEQKRNFRYVRLECVQISTAPETVRDKDGNAFAITVEMYELKNEANIDKKTNGHHHTFT
uniref:Uncharacterized protein n=1 Tax=Romanomermis culicivorax TaxID=13658 RepID=A0A915J6K8_ROMCU